MPSWLACRGGPRPKCPFIANSIFGHFARPAATASAHPGRGLISLHTHVLKPRLGGWRVGSGVDNNVAPSAASPADTASPAPPQQKRGKYNKDFTRSFWTACAVLKQQGLAREAGKRQRVPSIREAVQSADVPRSTFQDWFVRMDVANKSLEECQAYAAGLPWVPPQAASVEAAELAAEVEAQVDACSPGRVGRRQQQQEGEGAQQQEGSPTGASTWGTESGESPAGGGEAAAAGGEGAAGGSGQAAATSSSGGGATAAGATHAQQLRQDFEARGGQGRDVGARGDGRGRREFGGSSGRWRYTVRAGAEAEDKFSRAYCDI